MEKQKPSMFNKFAKFFYDLTSARESKEEEEKVVNSAVYNEPKKAADGTIMDFPGNSQENYGVADGQYTAIGVQFEQIFESKKQKVSKYREMSNFPEISESIENTCDEAINKDEDGNIVKLDIISEVTKVLGLRYQAWWEYIITDVIDFNKIGWKLFKRFLIDAELYGEKVLNTDGNRIIALNMLSPFNTTAVYKNGILDKFLYHQIGMGANNVGQTSPTVNKPKQLTSNQVSYINYGEFGSSQSDVNGYLEPSVRVYTQLRNLEDSSIVAQIARTPLRRIWNIYTGKMHKTKSESYIKGLMQRIKKRFFYDNRTGSVNVANNSISMTEDIFLPVDADGQGTKVDTLAGDSSTPNTELLTIFRNKLCQALHQPKSRWSDSASVYYSGKSGEMVRDEIKFSDFCDRILEEFAPFILDIYITQLKLAGFTEEQTKESNFVLKFNRSNLYKQYKQIEAAQAKLDIFGSASSYMYTDENKAGTFAPEFVLNKIAGYTNEEIAENEEMLKRYKNKVAGINASVEPSESSDQETIPPEEDNTSEPSPTEPSPTEGGSSNEEEAPPEEEKVSPAEAEKLLTPGA